MPEVGKGKCGWPRKCLMPAQLTIPDPSSIGKRLHEKPLKIGCGGIYFKIYRRMSE